MKKFLLIVLGSITLSLGIIGVFLPILPTTPFLLLSAACFLRSSEKLYNWLVNHKILGLYIRSYIIYKAISLKAKLISIVALWLVMVSTVVFFVSFLWLRILLLCIGLGVTVYISHFPTLSEEMRQSFEDTAE
jgi:uncharacterized protein